MPNALQVANSQSRRLEKLILKEGKLLLGSKINDDEECCLICGLSDYEDDD